MEWTAAKTELDRGAGRFLPPKTGPGLALASASAALAIVAIVTEVFTHLCAEVFFDPLPTPWHLLLVSVVPTGTIYCGHAARQAYPPDRRLQVLAAFCLGVASYYSLLFIPVMPVAVMGVVVLGLGLLPMAPLFSAGGALLAYRALAARDPDRGLRRLLTGLAGAMLVFAVIEAPQTLTRTGLAWAASEDDVKLRRGVSLLRLAGSEELLRRACYQRAGRATDLFTLLLATEPVGPESARLVYYRVYGKSFNSVPAPASRRRASGRDWDFAWDPEQGGEAVGGRVSGLSLSDSRLDGSVDGAAALAYLEWTMVFKNRSPRQQEARAIVSLPPGGAVSRVTLWVNGQEREAVFGGRGQVKSAYEAVVRQRRDPVLVTTRGPDRVMVQLFPVPGDGGEMKVRLGITAPFVAVSPERWVLQLPSVGERNFGMSDAGHSVWIESKRRLLAPGLASEIAPGGASALRGIVADGALSGGFAVRLADAPAAAAVGLDPAGGTVRQTLSESRETTPVVLVVDGSAGMAEALPAVAAALRESPAEAVFVASGERVLEWTPREAASRLAGLRGRGGQDNVPALLRAWDVAAAKRGVVVWVHGPLPVALSGAEVLRQRWERRPDGPRVHELVVGGGANVIANGLDELSRVAQMPRSGEVEQDLRSLLDRFGGRRPALSFRRERGDGPGERTSGHLARLWALDEIRRLLSSGRQDERDAALELSVAHRLVTPVSGAVVLETDQQYRDAGLETPPSNGAGVPVIPEPETWALILLSAAAFLWWMRRQPALA